METNDNINEKLKYIGLDLNDVPEKIANTRNINFRVKRNYDEKNYKVYKYINVNDIDIFLTPTHRLAEYTEKYAKALPISMFFNPVNEDDMERYTSFINMVNTLNIDDVKTIEEEQKRFNEKVPNSVKFYKDYMWQIYYAEDADKYFMLFPTKENEVAALFYILKKQIENKNEKIYVPICYSRYSQRYLVDSEIVDIENYLCFFTKEWPLLYEVYDKDENLTVQIIGRTYIYDNIRSEYKITLGSEEKARNFYQLVKALFILETQLSHHYKFKIRMDKEGSLHFYKDNEEVTFETLPKLIKQDYLKSIENVTKIKDNKIKLSKELKKLKKQAKLLNEEYLEKERQISIFLECRKTFFGKLKYFFKYKKPNPDAVEKSKVKEKEEPTGKLKYFEKTEIKEYYNLEELIKAYETLDLESNETRNLEQDINAMHKRIDVFKMKIKNANAYIKNIEEHKKSIFEFWRFINKEEVKALKAGAEEEQEVTRTKIKRAFNVVTDMEDLGKQFDLEERKIFEKYETDYAYISTTEVLKDLNLLLNNEQIPEEHLQKLKEGLENENKVGTIDIFGSILTSQEKIKTLGNIRHRENEKNKYAILQIKENTKIEEYSQLLKEVIRIIKKSMDKFALNLDIPVYMVGDLESKFNIFYINPEEAISKATKTSEHLYKINLTEGTKCLPLANIMYYNNANQTLPLGMNVSTGVLLDMEKLELKLKEEQQNYKIELKSEKTKSLELNISEYDMQG